MKKLLLAILLTIISTSAMAEWGQVSKGVETDLYIDFSTIKPVGNKVRMWSLGDNKITKKLLGGTEYRSYVSYEEYDCENEIVKAISVNFYKENMQNGGVVFKLESKEIGEQTTQIVPNTIGAILQKYACTLSGKK